MESPIITKQELDALSLILEFVGDWCDHDDVIDEKYGEDVRKAYRLLDRLQEPLRVRASTVP